MKKGKRKSGKRVILDFIDDLRDFVAEQEKIKVYRLDTKQVLDNPVTCPDGSLSFPIKGIRVTIEFGLDKPSITEISGSTDKDY
jgi:hypothetical protein